MCGHFEALLYLSFLKNTLGMTALPDDMDSSETARIAPTVGAPIVVQNPETWELEIIPARFGLIPHWYRGALKDWKGTTFNARLDTIAQKPAFKGPWLYRHALVPAHCFYEWSGPKTAREKWRIARGDNQPLAFAGVWDCASLAEGDIWSFAIITRDAGDDMRAIHDREPVVLHPEQWEDWLRNRPVDLTRSAPLQVMAA
ncbi:SOS response-associated peptidase [Asticcacaulis sp. 201]|uniref:SOS response-associated peptidase n=1 Tax=Asticcacaulis sp. 201 TaxID=3028787 RepID=UPI0029171210|nr:SOS response-associated peptidase [Asticcacaulis sp. 201]MDV6332661.1 SOS response-associated peptidase [Asticcacaulis sp. 201]